MYHVHGKDTIINTNKNTRTLGAGDYPAFEFILKVLSARKSEFLVFHDQKFVARSRVRQFRDLTRCARQKLFILQGIIVIIASSRVLSLLNRTLFIQFIV